MNQLLNSAGRSKSSNRHRTKRVYNALKGHTGNRNQRELKRKRHAKLYTAAKNHRIYPPVAAAHPKIRVCLKSKNKTESTAHHIGNQSSNTSPPNAKLEIVNKNHIQHAVENAGKNQKVQRSFRISQSAQHGRSKIVNRNHHHADTHNLHIGLRIGHDRIRSVEQAQNRTGSKKGNSTDSSRNHQHNIGRVGNTVFYLVGIALAKKVRSDNSTTRANSVTKRKKEKSNRASRTNRRQSLGSHKLPHNHRIHKIIKLLKNIPNQHRHRKSQQQTDRTSFRHIYSIISHINEDYSESPRPGIVYLY